MPTLVAPFGPQPTPHDRPDSGSVAEEIFAELVDRCRRLNVDPGDTAALLLVDLAASLAAYGRAPLGITLAVLAQAAPARALTLIEANQRGEPRPPSNAVKITAIANGCRLH